MTARTPRLTRAQSQERTRALIVEAATRLFLRDGFRATTLEQIGAEAGFTRGAVYSNFASKTAMGIAVIDGLYAREQEQLALALEQDDWLAAVAAWADASIGDPHWMRLELEIAASCAGDDDYRAATAARYAGLREHGMQLLAERFTGSSGVDTETLAIAALGLALGIGAQRAADPSIPGTAWSDGLSALLGLR